VSGSGVVARIKLRVSSQALKGQAITLALQNVAANDPNGQALSLSIIPGSPLVVSVSSRQSQTLPAAFALHANAPNPFNPSTTIFYDLPEPREVRLEIFDVVGKRVRTLVHERQLAGSYSVVWDGRDENAQAVASGIYLYQLHAGLSTGSRQSFVQTRRMALVR
jgi:hypothetical protein